MVGADWLNGNITRPPGSRVGMASGFSAQSCDSARARCAGGPMWTEDFLSGGVCEARQSVLSQGLAGGAADGSCTGVFLRPTEEVAGSGSIPFEAAGRFGADGCVAACPISEAVGVLSAGGAWFCPPASAAPAASRNSNIDAHPLCFMILLPLEIGRAKSAVTSSDP